MKEKEKKRHDPKLNKRKGVIQDEETRRARRRIHQGLEGELGDNEEENTGQKGFDRSSRGYKGD